MKILVCITHVPDTTSKINFKDNNTKFDPTGVQFIIGPYDDYALARAVELKESTGSSLTVLNVGLAETEPTIRKALAIGADDAIRVNAEPTDSVFVATQIAEQARAGGYDLILMGRESIDYNSGVVHGLVGEMLGIPSVSPVMKLDLDGTKAKLAESKFFPGMVRTGLLFQITIKPKITRPGCIKKQYLFLPFRREILDRS